MDVCSNRGAERCSEIGGLCSPMDDAIPKGIHPCLSSQHVSFSRCNFPSFIPDSEDHKDPAGEVLYNLC